MKHKLAQGIFDRLADAGAAPGVSVSGLISVEQIKRSVARDVESLLNCRCAIDRETLRAYPESSRSLVSYGMPDFVGSSLVNPGDRRRLCASIEEALAVHEKRLTRISVVLEIEEGAVNRLCFVIHALLRVHSLAEPVYFDALLQPSTLQYACRHRPFAPR